MRSHWCIPGILKHKHPNIFNSIQFSSIPFHSIQLKLHFLLKMYSVLCDALNGLNVLITECTEGFCWSLCHSRRQTSSKRSASDSPFLITNPISMVLPSFRYFSFVFNPTHLMKLCLTSSKELHFLLSELLLVLQC